MRPASEGNPEIMDSFPIRAQYIKRTHEVIKVHINYNLKPLISLTNSYLIVIVCASTSPDIELKANDQILSSTTVLGAKFLCLVFHVLNSGAACGDFP